MSLASSFRDPSGFCFQFEKRILRAVTPEGLSELEVFLHSETAREFTGKEALISTRRLNDSAVTELRAGFAFRIENKTRKGHEKKTPTT